MNFVSYEFLALFASVILSRLILPYKIYKYTLLIANYIFYGAWSYKFLLLLIFSSFVDYSISILIDEKYKRKEFLRWVSSKQLLCVAMISNLFILGIFKYYNFFAEAFEALLLKFGIVSNFYISSVILPMGISFYTFQTMSYTIDVYRRELGAERNILDYLLFVSYFPQLVAGPIERAGHLLGQIKVKLNVTRPIIISGLSLMLIGYLKKMLVADNAAPIVDSIFSQDEWAWYEVLLASYLFSMQIYCDFSGYSDIARGASRILGIELMKNFDRPYLATSPSDFWKRWHISLSTWLRDYLYIPLGGNRNGKAVMYKALFLTMLLGGIWHGANWTFVLWGAYHGGLLILFRILSEKSMVSVFMEKIPNFIKIFLYFHVTCFGWIIFRSESLSHFYSMISSFFSMDFSSSFLAVIPHFAQLSSQTYLIYTLLLLVFYESVLYIEPKAIPHQGASVSKFKYIVSALFYIIVLELVLIHGFDNVSNFIYFQF